MLKVAFPFLLLLMTSTACATFPDAHTGDKGRTLEMDLLTRQDLTDPGCRSAFDAVKRLRPQWLRSRDPVRFAGSREIYPQVVVNGIWMGNPSELRLIPVEGVEEMRFLTAQEANLRFGLGYPSGAIEIRIGSR